MKNGIVTFVLISCSVLLISCGVPKTEEGELTEIDYEDFEKLIEDEQSQPFLLVTTDASEKDFDNVAKDSFEDALLQSNEGAFYMNLTDTTDEEIDSINSFGSDYDASSDAVSLVNNGSIEKTDVRISLSEDVLNNTTQNEDDFSKMQESDIQQEIKESIEDVTNRK